MQIGKLAVLIASLALPLSAAAPTQSQLPAPEDHIGDAWNDKVSSFEPSGGVFCFLFRDAGCQGGYYVANTRVNSMPGFNDQTTSFQCNI
ncbi:hypothetical protein LZ31DRAFT_591646 [Colletotrichum somersetense]|nr:hypothetical protein LZ31DRAFT_591646 [Colletotrichum somersetense]